MLHHFFLKLKVFPKEVNVAHVPVQIDAGSHEEGDRNVWRGLILLGIQ